MTGRDATEGRGALYAISSRRYTFHGDDPGPRPLVVSFHALGSRVVRGAAESRSGEQILLLELQAVDSARIRDDADDGWRTVESHRVRLTEPRC